MTKMKALVKAKAEKGIWLQEVDIPEIGPNDVLIKISKTAICGTDLHIYKWDEWAQQTIKTPVIIGHEYMGTVVEVGSEVDRVKVGERVTVEGHIACGFCRNCRRGRQHICDHTIGIGVQRDGGFAEYIGKKYDVKLDCITISQRQFEYTKERIHKCGLNEKVNIEIKDYRDLKGKYNSIASIEMIEAVGQNYLDSYFNTIKKSYL